MITAYSTQHIGNHLIQELVREETEKRMAEFYRGRAAEMAAKDAEIAELRGKLEIREKRAAKNYQRMAEMAEAEHYVKKPCLPHRIILCAWGCMTIAANWWTDLCGLKRYA